MRVRCNREGTEFEAMVVPYPVPKGAKYIECPTCHRRYFYDSEKDKWESDRPLVILSNEEKP